MTTLTVDDMSKLLKIKKRSARARLHVLTKAGKARPVDLKIGRNGTGKYELYFPLRELLMCPSEVQLVANGKINYKQFCADPFNLGKGAR